ncbi:DUF58 domain-containing protein [Nocardioides pacificus]
MSGWTTLGRATLACCLVVAVLGVWQGWLEFLALALVLAVALLVAVVHTRGDADYAVHLELVTPRVGVGEPAAGRVVVANRARRPLAGVRVELPFGTLSLPRMAGGAEHTEEFAVPTDRRAVIPLGPVTAVRGDTLGLIRRTQVWPEVVEQYVHPRTLRLDGAAASFLRDVDGAATLDLSSSDLAFHSLRDYVPGDDRRAIHWRTTARVGRLVIRQFEETKRTQLLVALTVRAEDYAAASEFELAVSAAASLSVQALREGREVAVVTQAGPLAFRTPTALLDRLSGLEWQPDPARLGPQLGDVASRGLALFPHTSVCALVLGSGAGPDELASAAATLPRDVAAFAVRCLDGQPPARHRVQQVDVLDVADLADLPRGLRTLA